MGQKNLKGSVTILKYAGRIRLRWRHKKQRYSKNLFEFNKKNLLLAKKIAVAIESDMDEGSFDLTLSKYEPANFRKSVDRQTMEAAQKVKAAPNVPQGQKDEKVPVTFHQEEVNSFHPLVNEFESWVKNYRNMDCDKDCDYHSTRGMMKRWGSFDVAEVVSKLNKETISASTYNRRLGCKRR
jgi:hypothetical protein